MHGSLPIDEPQLSTELARVLENSCQQGCTHVDGVIEGLQNGSVPAAASLNEDEISNLLLELLEVIQPLQHE